MKLIALHRPAVRSGRHQRVRTRHSPNPQVKNAIRVAKEFAENQVNAKLETELSQVGSYAKGCVPD